MKTEAEIKKFLEDVKTELSHTDLNQNGQFLQGMIRATEFVLDDKEEDKKDDTD